MKLGWGENCFMAAVNQENSLQGYYVEIVKYFLQKY